MIQSDYYMQEDKKKIKMPVEDANTAFSLGLWQKIGEEKYSDLKQVLAKRVVEHFSGLILE